MQDGKIVISKCTCEASESGTCTHVSCLLHLILDIATHKEPKISQPCTSQSQNWGHGKKRARDPKFIVDSVPSAMKFSEFDPRPPALRYTCQKKTNDFLIDCHDYSLTDERKQEIEAESSLFISSMRKGLEKYASDPLTNDFSYHITGTIDQADSDLWHSMRIHRITASKFKEWLSSANTAIDRFWSGSEDISNLPSIKWGREKESE